MRKQLDSDLIAINVKNSINFQHGQKYIKRQKEIPSKPRS